MNKIRRLFTNPLFRNIAGKSCLLMFLLLFAANAAFAAVSGARAPLQKIPMKLWNPADFDEDNTVWGDKHYGALGAAPVFLKDINAENPTTIFSDFGREEDARFYIQAKDISRISILIPEFAESTHVHPNYRVDLKNGVYFYAVALDHGFEYQTTKEGYPAKVTEEWPTMGSYFDKNSILNLIASLKIENDRAIITYVNGRTIETSEWGFFASSRRNWNPVKNSIDIQQDNSPLTIPLADIVSIDMNVPDSINKESNQASIKLSDGKPLKGSIGNPLLWRGTAEIVGVLIEMQGSYAWMEQILLIGDDAPVIIFRKDHPVLFNDN